MVKGYLDEHYVQVYITFYESDRVCNEISYNGIRFFPLIRFEEEGDMMPRWTANIIILIAIDSY